MWAHAEDLDTLEFTLMQVIAYVTGPVRIGIPTSFFLLMARRLLALLIRMLFSPQDVDADFADDVSDLLLLLKKGRSYVIWTANSVF